MKVVIMEIHKDYCIVMTKDGQFIKKKIMAGAYEIGDEIIISEYSYQPEAARVNWVKNFVVGAIIVAAITAGSIWVIRYMKEYFSPVNMALTAQDGAGEETRIEAEESQADKGAQEQAFTMDEDQEEAVVYGSVYSLEEGTRIEEEIDGIMFSYEVMDSVSMYVKLENISRTPYFNGTFGINTLLSDGSPSRTLNPITLQRFKPGNISESSFILKAGETQFRLIITENNY